MADQQWPCLVLMGVDEAGWQQQCGQQQCLFEHEGFSGGFDEGVKGSSTGSPKHLGKPLSAAE
ncbi:hypothetical protein KUIN1_44250 [Pseudomonas sp. KUIN-1]|nr:hypothetical protein KUIN1_44250 [Pseudomonas sp. KUIN-1]